MMEEAEVGMTVPFKDPNNHALKNEPETIPGSFNK